MKDKCGIYSITNRVTNKLYIGYSSNFSERWCNHRNELRRNIHDNEHLQRAWNLHGESNFKFERIEICYKYELVEREHYWCKLLKTHNRDIGYNEKETGEGAPSGMLGKKHTEESKMLISQNRKGKLVGKDNPFYGRKHTEEWKKKASENRIGKPNVKLIGRRLTDQHRENLRTSHIGQVVTDEQRKRRSERAKNDPKTKDRIAHALKSKYRAVVRLNSKGQVTADYSTIKEAAVDNEIDSSWIRKCCSKLDPKHKKTRGHYWMYKEEYYAGIKEGGYHKGIYIPVYIGV